MSNIQLFNTAGEADKAVQANRVCRVIGGALAKAYPTRKWYVDVTIVGGVAKIMCPAISERWAYQIFINKSDYELERAAIKAGGQILEMFRLSRAKNADTRDEADIARNPLGEAIKVASGL